MASKLLISAPVRILIIDDDRTFCGYLAEMLSSLGHDVESVSDGLVGFERCLRNPYDVVVCDVRMPLILGTELVAELRRDRPSLEVILISAFADQHLAAQAAQVGARLLSKPFDAAVLERALLECAATRTAMAGERPSWNVVQEERS